MNITAIIPARGGSKKIPRKNIKLFLGKPLIYYSIKQAQESKYINRIILTTDDEEIRQIGIKYGAEAPFLRPKEISDDLSTDEVAARVGNLEIKSQIEHFRGWTLTVDRKVNLTNVDWEAFKKKADYILRSPR